jgi:GntR family transcriptional regulator
VVDIVISPKSEMPIYEQVYVQIASQVLNGQLAVNAPLPSIRTVARELGISVITIKKAWELLEADDLIYTRTGKGSFVSDHVEDRLRDKRRAFAVERFRRDASFYRELEISREELVRIVEDEY